MIVFCNAAIYKKEFEETGVFLYFFVVLGSIFFCNVGTAFGKARRLSNVRSGKEMAFAGKVGEWDK